MNDKFAKYMTNMEYVVGMAIFTLGTTFVSSFLGYVFAFFTFVTLDENGKPIKSIEVKPKTDEEKKLFDGALRRRQLRLILAGKMKPEEADELKSIFD